MNSNAQIAASRQAEIEIRRVLQWLSLQDFSITDSHGFTLTADRKEELIRRYAGRA